ncbi:hypothetical protein EB74_04670 [Mycobacterium sp. SWH-M5]|nr:hypothetical protein EB74_04670 [Mycobacterium sp. SWH-M5]
MNDDEFWSATDQLKLTHQWARASYVAPRALLLSVLLRVIASTEPTVMLPGPPAPASLNMGLVLIGRSGAGKGITDKLARTVWPADIIEKSPASGQGISDLFKVPKNPEDRITRAIFSVSEVDQLAALHANQGSTTRATLKAALTGDQLGGQGATSATTREVPADSYRLGLSISAQYGHTDVLMGDVTGGTPQRFLWAAVADPGMPDKPGPTPDRVLDTTLPPWATAGHQVLIQYGPAEIAEAVRLAQVARGRDEIDPLDGHRTLTRLKVAAALAILDHRMVISELDWALSEHIMARSDETRNSVIEYDRQAARAKVRDRAISRAIGEQFIADHKLERAKKSILRWLERDGQLARHNLRRKLKADLRDHFDPAIAELAAEGRIAETSVKNGVEYSLSAEGARVPPVHPPNPQVSDRVPEVHGVPDATVTELDSRRSQESEPKFKSCGEWLAHHRQQLLDSGQTTTDGFAVRQAGRAAGYSDSAISMALHQAPEWVATSRRGGQNRTAQYDITGLSDGYKSAEELVREYLDTQVPANTDVIDKDHFAAWLPQYVTYRRAEREVISCGRVTVERDPQNATKTIWRVAPKQTPQENAS